MVPSWVFSPPSSLTSALAFARSVGAIAGHVGREEQAAGPGEALRARVAVLEELGADRLGVRGVVDRLPRLGVVERRGVRVELDVVGRGRELLGDLQLRVLLHLVDERGRRQVLVGLRLPGLQRLVGRLVAADRLEGQLVQEGAALLEVRRVLLEDDLRAELVADHGEGPGAHGHDPELALAELLDRGGRGDPVGVGVDERRRGRRVDRGEVDDDVVARGRHGLDRPRRPAGARGLQDLVDVVGHHLGGEGRAVGELHPGRIVSVKVLPPLENLKALARPGTSLPPSCSSISWP